MSTYKISRFFQEAGWKVQVFSFATESDEKPEHDIPCIHAKLEGGAANSANIEQWRALVREFQPKCIINQSPYEHPIAEQIKDLHKQLGFVLLACLRNSLFSVKLNIEQYQKDMIPALLQPAFNNAIGHAMAQVVHRFSHARNLRRLLKAHDRFVVFAEPNIRELEYFVGTSYTRQCELVPNSIPDVDEVARPKELILLYVGRLEEYQKRAHFLLPLWKKIRGSLPEWQFHIVGDGPIRGDMERDAQQEGLDDVSFHGRCDPYPHYEQASMLVMLSSFEGFPNVLVEAQSRAVAPVIIDSYPIAGWLIEDGDNGRLLPHFDLDAVARAIVELGKSPEALARIQARALESVRRFQIDQVGKQWLEVIERVSQEKRTPGTGA